MKLIILQPNGTVFNGDVESVTLPGKNGRFTLLTRHAPLISTLEKGVVKYRKKNSDVSELLDINGGFIKIKNDLVTVCID
ncbi:MAG: ATP synthase F1 subunit epsilon [Rikenellaceae bacterium]